MTWFQTYHVILLINALRPRFKELGECRQEIHVLINRIRTFFSLKKIERKYIEFYKNHSLFNLHPY